MSASTVKEFSVRLCRRNRKSIYVFGDNLDGYGVAGQACIRYELNSYGIPIKRHPNNLNISFFRDREDEQEVLFFSLEHLRDLPLGQKIVFPAGGLGTGLSQMKLHSPKLFQMMNDFIRKEFFPEGGWDW